MEAGLQNRLFVIDLWIYDTSNAPIRLEDQLSRGVLVDLESDVRRQAGTVVAAKYIAQSCSDLLQEIARWSRSTE